MVKDNLILLRKLNGYSQEDIAEKIGISRIDSLIHTASLDDKTIIPPVPKGKHIFGTVTVSDRGQIVIPKQARDLFEIKGGDRLIVLGDESEGLAFVKEKVFTDSINMAMKLASNILYEE